MPSSSGTSLPQNVGAVAKCSLADGNSLPCEQLRVAHDQALLAAAAYAPNGSPLPPGYIYLDPDTPVGQAKLAKLGLLDPDQVGTGGNSYLTPADSSFRAAVFEKAGDPPAYVVSFRGTQTSNDWLQNFEQATGFESDSYNRAKALAARIASSPDVKAGAELSFTGHSLGGGMASAAAFVTGKPAWTFNAAGLNAATVEEYPNEPNVKAFYSPSDPLNKLQDNRETLLSGLIIGTGFSPIVQAALAAWIGSSEITGSPLVPRAYGDRHLLPYEPPSNPEAYRTSSVIDKLADLHGMDRVTRGIEAQQKAQGCIR